MQLEINGRSYRVSAAPRSSLLDVLREQLDLTGAKYGCGEGQCGACTILLDGAPRHACLVSLAEAANAKITTIEGLAADGALHPVQQAFLDAGAWQCGYCTPGMILAAVALLRRRPRPSRAEIVAALDGNLCRCGTYPRIVAAVEGAARALAAAGRQA